MTERGMGGSPERMMAYTDAVVAIAQTLLILPLLEGVSDARAHHLNASAWLAQSSDLILWFAVSFVLIGSFWLVHHRVFDHVAHVSAVLQSLNFVWLFAIVFMPVSTALLGLNGPDLAQAGLYVGAMLLSGLAMNAVVILLSRHPELVEDGHRLRAGNVAASFSMTLLLLVSLVLVLLTANFYGMFAMCLMHLSVRLLTPAVRRAGLAT